MVTATEAFRRGPELPRMKNVEPSLDSRTEKDYSSIPTPNDLIGRSVRVHKKVTGQNDSYVVEQHSMGTIVSVNDDKYSVNITSKDCGTFPVPLAHIWVGADHCRASYAPLKGRNCMVLRDHSARLTKNTRCILIGVSQDGLRCQVKLPNDNAEFNIPGGALSIRAPADAARPPGRMVMRKVNPTGPVSIPVGALGYVTSMDPNGFNIAVMGNGGNRITSSPANEWEFGAVQGEFTMGTVPRPQLANKDYAKPVTGKVPHFSDSLRFHSFQLQQDIAGQRTNLKNFNQRHFQIMDTLPKRQVLANDLEEGVKLACGQAMLNLLQSGNFTMADVFGRAKVVRSGNHSAGVYFRGYGKFKSSRRRAWLRCIYAGMTGDMAIRDKKHGSNQNNQDSARNNGVHYITARDSTDRRVVQIFQLPAKYDNYTAAAKKTILEVMEVQFFLLFHTLHSDLCGLNSEERVPPTDEAYIGLNADWRSMASALTEIAAKSAKTSK
ncbi:unnamed protein product [Zymoseptoria tritici ST99CH_3D1]|nr:unnamed protein product [Zymoseptoria tritici ST99CH_3D1]